jgi:hypothetical protein
MSVDASRAKRRCSKTCVVRKTGGSVERWQFSERVVDLFLRILDIIELTVEATVVRTEIANPVSAEQGQGNILGNIASQEAQTTKSHRT